MNVDEEENGIERHRSIVWPEMMYLLSFRREAVNQCSEEDLDALPPAFNDVKRTDGMMMK